MTAKESINNIVALLGNILDNAIEAEQNVLNTLERFVSLTINYYNHSLTIVCENKVDRKIDTLVSKKADISNHGMGIKSIIKIVEKYSGSQDITSTDDIFRIELILWDFS